MVVAQDEAAAERRLQELRTIYGMLEGCALNETFLQRAAVGGLELNMVGLVAAAPDGSSVTGAAADPRGFPVDRAYFELIERLSIFVARKSNDPLYVRDLQGRAKGARSPSRVFPADDTPESLRASLSNGVALHASWDLACESALSELVERDRVLRSFAGEYAPSPLEHEDPPLAQALRGLYRVEAYSFGPKRKKLSRIAAGVFLFPEQADAPLAYGFGAGRELAAALDGAKREALQRLAFLWGEPLPAAPPVAAPTPDYHQEYYLYPEHHGVLRAWLDGQRVRRAGRTQPSEAFDGQPVTFIDLAPKGLDSLSVAKATSARARVLRFGTKSARAKTPPHPIA